MASGRYLRYLLLPTGLRRSLFTRNSQDDATGAELDRQSSEPATSITRPQCNQRPIHLSEYAKAAELAVVDFRAGLAKKVRVKLYVIRLKK